MKKVVAVIFAGCLSSTTLAQTPANEPSAIVGDSEITLSAENGGCWNCEEGIVRINATSILALKSISVEVKNGRGDHVDNRRIRLKGDHTLEHYPVKFYAPRSPFPNYTVELIIEDMGGNTKSAQALFENKDT